MPDTTLRAYFDFIDPLSYCALRAIADAPTEWVGVELRPPPSPLTRVDDPLWEDRWDRARALAREIDVALDPPRLVPWSRKAHEVHAFAREHGADREIRDAVFTAYFRDGRDIGRVDVLVDVAASMGLDRTETKAVLDVDRYQAVVVEAQRRAREAGVVDVPSFGIAGTPPEGFPRLQDLGTLLPRS